MTIFPALASCKQQSVKLNLIDAPGYAEFVGQVVPCLWVAETVLLVLDAVAGVEVHTRRMWTMAREQGLAAVAIVNKLDKERSDFETAVKSRKDSLGGTEFVPVQLPVGESGVRGVIDLIAMKAILGEGSAAAEIPADSAEAAEAGRDALVDAVAATDDDLTNAPRSCFPSWIRSCRPVPRLEYCRLYAFPHLKRREVLGGIGKQKLPAVLIYTLHDDNVGVVPQLATGSLAQLTGELCGTAGPDSRPAIGSRPTTIRV